MDYGKSGNENGSHPPTIETNGTSDVEKNRSNAMDGRTAHHVIAFSGGIDSSVAAALVHRIGASASASPSQPLLSSGVYGSERVTAVLGLSPAVPMDQRKLAEDVASIIGVTLEQVSTTEGTDEVYVANDGRACLACKTHLYDNLKSISEQYCPIPQSATGTVSFDSTAIVDTIMYNGTNADDLRDPTRLGLIAAQDFSVRSPLAGLPKDRVRMVGRHLGLPNWDYAASPCLRSRLAVGVAATADRLEDVGAAEIFVKDTLGKDQPDQRWDVRKSLRVRILSKNRAMIEVDDDGILKDIEERLETPHWKRYFEDELGFASVGVRRFKTGSVAPPPPKHRIATIASPTGGIARKLRRRP
jgi:PP-loop superfamily ATP-utilizing enzyme